MKKYYILAFASVLVACGKPDLSAPHVQQPAPVVQQQTDNSLDIGTMAAAGAVGYLLGKSNSPNTTTNQANLVQNNTVIREKVIIREVVKAPPKTYIAPKSSPTRSSLSVGRSRK